MSIHAVAVDTDGAIVFLDTETGERWNSQEFYSAEDIAASDFAQEYPQRFEDDYLKGDDAAREAFITDAVDFGI